MRYQYPQKTPEPKPQRYEQGTRVANPLEGRTGHIERFDAVQGVYRLVFNDGFEEDVADAEVDRFVIRPAADTASTQGAAVNGDDDAVGIDRDPDPHALIGRAVTKSIESYEGATMTLRGSVAAFFPSADRYRVVFETGLCEDLSVADTKKAVAAAASNSNGSNNSTEPSDGPPSKKQRTERTEPLLNAQPFPSRMAAYAILRKVVRAILAQQDIKKFATDKQRTVLSNMDIKPKRALEQFVEADGLKLLQKVLVRWMRQTESHAGAMLVLKLLAALPGVTPDAVLASHVGKTLRGIVRVSREMDHVDAVLGDLAGWVIATWRRDVVPKGVSSSARTQTSLQAAESMGAMLPSVRVELPQGKQKQKASMTAHLRALLNAESEPTVPADQEQVPFFANYNSLGSIDKRRPVRRVIHIESLVERVQKRRDDERMEEEQKKKKEGDEGTDADEEVTDAPTNGRIRFRLREEVLLYNQNVAPANMMHTARSKIMAKQRRDSHDELDNDLDLDDGAQVRKLPPPNTRTTPVKPILKLLDEVIVPANKIIWN